MRQPTHTTDEAAPGPSAARSRLGCRPPDSDGADVASSHGERPSYAPAEPRRGYQRHAASRSSVRAHPASLAESLPQVTVLGVTNRQGALAGLEHDIYFEWMWQPDHKRVFRRGKPSIRARAMLVVLCQLS